MEIPELLHIPAAFSGAFSDLCVRVLLTNSDLRWTQPASESLAPRAGTWTLDSASKIASARFALLSRSYQERVLAALCARSIDFDPEGVIPQCFATRMIGTRHTPPHILPHRDCYSVGTAQFVTPVLSCVYYPLVRDCEGGDLVVHRNGSLTSADCISVAPATGDLIVVGGRVVHSVTPLMAGDRVSLVLNLYAPSESLNSQLLN